MYQKILFQIGGKTFWRRCAIKTEKITKEIFDRLSVKKLRSAPYLLNFFDYILLIPGTLKPF